MSGRSQNWEVPRGPAPGPRGDTRKGCRAPRLAHLGDAVLVGHHADDVVQREQRVTLDLSVDVLALCAHSQELHQVDVVHEGAAFVHPVPLRPHHLDQRLERGSVVVEHEDVLARVHQLRRGQGLFVLRACRGGDSVKIKALCLERRVQLASQTSLIYTTFPENKT